MVSGRERRKRGRDCERRGGKEGGEMVRGEGRRKKWRDVERSREKEER